MASMERAMKVLAALVAVASIVVVLLAVTAIGLLSILDSGMDIAIDPLVRGDLTPLFTSRVFLWEFPAWPYRVAPLLVFGPAVTMAAVGALLLAAQRRWHWPAGLVALLALLAGVVPYAVGTVALHDNTVPQAAGAWLVWMLAGPMYAALLGLAFLIGGAWQTWRTRELAAVRRSGRHASAPAS